MGIQLLGVLAGMLFPFATFSQELKGTVKDTTGAAVPYASVTVRKKAGDAVVAYTTTDVKGAYVLKLSSNVMRPSSNVMLLSNLPADSFYMEARCMGFKAQRKELAGLPLAIDFVLTISADELQSVVVRSSRPVLHTSGDTLSYKVSDFRNAQDRVIADVLKRLPGITVAEDGTISYNNRPVSGVYIGGDNLLDDKYTIGTNTIPQSVVDQVQLIDNHQPIKALQGKVASNDVAINLTFTDAARLRLLGQETVGAGLPGNYYADLNAMLFNNRYKAINYLKGNNTGEDLQRELVSHNSAGNVQRTGNDPPATVLSLGSVNNPDLARQRYLFNRSELFNVNDLVNLHDGLQLRFNGYFLHDRQQQDYSQRTSVFLPGDTVRYSEVQHNRSNPSLLHAQFTLNVNKERYYLNNVLLMDDNRSLNYSDLNTNGALVKQVFRDHSLGFSNEFNWIRAVRSGKVIIEGYSYISHLAEPESRTIGPGYNAEQFNHGVPYDQLVQTVNVPTWFTNDYVSFKIPGRVVTQSFKTGFSVQSQKLASDLSVLQSTGAVDPESDSSLNRVGWGRRRLYAAASCDIPDGKLKANLTLPLTFQRLNYSDADDGLEKAIDRLYFNPQLNLKYQTGNENFVTFQYSYHNETGGIEDIYQGHILTDYRTLYANNAELTLRQNHQAGTGFAYRRALKLFFASVNVLYNRVGANNIAASVITDNLQQRVVLPYPNSTDSWTVTGSISKYSFALHTTFSGGGQWQGSHSVQILNDALLPFYTMAEMLRGSAETKLSNQLNLSYRVTGAHTGGHSQAGAAAVRVDRLQQQMAIDYNPFIGLQVKLSGEHYFTRRRGGADLTYFFADARVKYRVKRWRTDLELGAVNFLNVKRYDALYLSVNSLAANSYALPGRIVLLKVLFNL